MADTRPPNENLDVSGAARPQPGDPKPPIGGPAPQKPVPPPTPNTTLKYVSGKVVPIFVEVLPEGFIGPAYQGQISCWEWLKDGTAKPCPEWQWVTNPKGASLSASPGANMATSAMAKLAKKAGMSIAKFIASKSTQAKKSSISKKPNKYA